MDVPMDPIYKELKGIVKGARQTLKYATDMQSNYENLKGKEKNLLPVKNGILAEADKHKQKQLSERWEAWIFKVKEINKDVEELDAQYKGVKWYKKAELSKKIEKKWVELEKLKSEGEGFREKLVAKPPERVIPIAAEETADKPSHHKVIEKILGDLKKTDISSIGLWGMPGIGKTNILKNLNNNNDVAEMFEIVIWVDVRNYSEEILRDAIARRLKLVMEDSTSAYEIESWIKEELEKKSCLLLLDDVWKCLDLRYIGIPADKTGTKVVLTARHRNVCYQMKVDEQIKLEGLSPEDAYKMFREKAGRNVDLPGVEPIAQQITQECAGSPLLINIAAKAFGSKESCESWKCGLRSLTGWYCFKLEGEDDLSGFLEFFYETLKTENEIENENTNFCFLYTALYPEGSDIYKDYLFECWNAEGFIHASKLIEAREKGEVILEKFINASFLEKSAKMNHVKMNRVLRKMAFRICPKSDDFKALVKTGEGQQPPGNMKWEELRRISLFEHDPSMGEISKCKNLLTLLVRKNEQLPCEPFFTFLTELRVLDLCGVGITSLPSSISCLRRLSALYLNACSRLIELPFKEQNSMDLEVLDIQNTGINHLATEISFLTGLKALRISLSQFGWRKSENEFHLKVLPELHRLEELRIEVVPQDLSWKEGVHAIIEDVVTLKNLTSLSICFPTVDCLRLLISDSESWRTLDFKFQFSVGHHDSTRYQIHDFFEYPIRKSLKFVGGEGISEVISDVLAKTDVFELIDYEEKVKLSDFGIENIKNIRGCLIKGCSQLETVVQSGHTDIEVLKSLEHLSVDNVPNLRSIWEGDFGAGSLARLETITLCNCLNLKKIFSSGMIAALGKLQKLEVQECPVIEEIIMKSENQNLQSDALRSLKILVLLNLRILRSIGFNDLMTWPSLRRVRISGCPSLEELPFKNDNPINLECVEVERSWWDPFQRTKVAVKDRLQTKIKFI